MEFLRLARPGKNVTQLTDIARAAQGDLRQALIRLDFFAGSSRRAVTATDGRAPHALFDAQDALCDGKTVELDYSAMRWVQHNHLKVDCDIGIHATFAESMTGWDTLSTSQGGNDPEVRPDLLNLPPAIATMATHQLIGTKRGRFKLDNPADLESDFKRHKSDYPKGYDEQRVLKLCADPDRTAKPTASSAAAAGGGVSVAAPPEQTTAPLDTERAATGGVVSVAAPPDAEQAAEDDKQNAPSGVSAPSDREASAAHAAGEVFAQSAEAAYLICKGRGGALVPCTAQRVKGEAPELDIEPYVQKSANTTFRRMAWCVLVARGERPALGDAWLELCDTIKSDANNFSMIMADTKKGHVVLLYKGNGGNDKVIKTGKPWEAFKLASKDPLPFAKALLRCVEAIFTINLQEPEQLQRVTALEAIQPYMKMDEIAFKAHMTDLKEQRRLGGRLSPEEEFMVNHTKDMEQLKQLLLKKERMRAMLKDVDSTLRFPWDFTLTPQTLRVFRICPDTLRREVSDRPVDAILDSVGLHTIVFFGAPGKGKTPCAKALASLYSQTNGKTKFVETQTADSLRKLSEFDLLQEGEGVVLDEWQPRREACGPQGGGVEHVKNMLDPADAKTIEARFSDFTLPESCARFVTCQNLGKLLSNFRDLTADTDERQLRALTEEDDDAKAILKRCVFVDVRDHLIRPELRTVHRETRCSKGEALRSTANRARQSEDGHPLSVQLGLWRQVAPGAATK